MKRFRILSLILTLCMLLGVFAACSGNENPPVESTEAAPETTAEPAGIVMSLLSEYKVIRPENAHADVVDAAVSIREAMLKLVDKVDIKTDFYKEGVPGLSIDDHEILVGNTERPESQEFLSGLKKNDYGYALIGTKIVIAGGDDAGTILAVKKFVSDVLKPLTKESEIFYSETMNFLFTAKYKFDSLSICGVSFKDYRIVYKNGGSFGEDIMAEMIADKLEAYTGIRPEVVSDKKAGDPLAHEILVGDTVRDTTVCSACKPGESVILFDGNNIKLGGADATGLGYSAGRLISMIEAASSPAGTVTLNAETKISYDASVLTGMSFNVKVNPYNSERKDRVVNMVKKYLPDTVGFQEASPSWMTGLKSGLSDVYAYVGEGRDGGNSGEYNPIFYKKSLFNLIDSGTRWLSDNPKYPSRYSESSLNRIYTYALLERKSDGTKIMVINTHLEHTSSAARVLQAKVLAAFISECLDYPVIITGDFNTTSGTTEFNTVLNAGVADSAYHSDVATRAATYTSYGTASKIIDFIFINLKKTHSLSYKVCNEMLDGDYPSDHHPVLIEYTVVG